MRRLFLIMILLLCCAVSFAQTYTVSGTVLNKKTKAPVEFATVVAVECEQWSVADDKGRFTLKNIPAGKNTLSVSCLGSRHRHQDSHHKQGSDRLQSFPQ